MTRSTMFAAIVLVAFAACKKDKESAKDSAKDKDKPAAKTKKPAATADAGTSAAIATPDAAPAAIATPDAAPAAIAPPDAAPATPTTPAHGALLVTPEGIGPITAKLKVSEKSLAKALPDYKVKKVKVSLGDDLEDEFFTVSRGDTVLLKVRFSGTEVSTIEIVSPEIELPHGLKIGATHADITRTIGELVCENGGGDGEWRDGVAFCTAAKAPGYSLDFMDLDEEGAPESLATDLLEDPALLATATLTGVFFRP